MAESRVLKKWHKGEQLTAVGVNDIQDLLQSVTHGPTETPGGNRQILWVRLKEWIGPEGDFVDRDGVMQYYDTATNKWKDTSPEQTIALIVDPQAGMAYAPGMIIPVQSHGAGKYVPLWPGLTTLEGTLDEALAPGDVATMSVKWRNSDGDWVDTGVNVEVCASPLLPEDADDIPSGSFVVANCHPPRGASFPAYWGVIQSECSDAAEE